MHDPRFTLDGPLFLTTVGVETSEFGRRWVRHRIKFTVLVFQVDRVTRPSPDVGPDLDRNVTETREEMGGSS